MTDLPDPIQYAIPFFIVLIIAELIYARQTGKAKFEPGIPVPVLPWGLAI